MNIHEHQAKEILKKYGADILRIWVASSNYAEDLRIDYSILDQHAESYRKIRNTFRFLLGNLKDEKINFDLNSKEIEKWPEIERYILHQIYVLDKNFKKYLKEYNFHKLYKELLSFCSLDLSAFYFDIRKDVLYCDDLKSEKRKISKTLLKSLNFKIAYEFPFDVFFSFIDKIVPAIKHSLSLLSSKSLYVFTLYCSRTSL